MVERVCGLGALGWVYNRFMAKKINEKILKYNVIFQPEPEGGYTVVVPSLRGCVTYGETLDEARSMAIDAIQGFIECLREDGEKIPSDAEAVVTVLGFRASNFAAV